MKKLKDVKIEVFSIDEDDKCYLAIVMGLGNDWFNTGIVVRESDPIIAFTKALERAKEAELWK